MKLSSPELDLPGIAHGFFTREGGVSTGIYASLNAGPGSGDDPTAVAENRRRVAAALGAEALWSVHQVHGRDVHHVSAPPEGPRPRADAMVTRTAGLALGVLTADCGPVLFADAAAGVVGAAHAGWKGALGGVLAATVAAMEGFGARRTAIRAVLGPSLGRDSYEVGPEFADRFLADDTANARFFHRPDGHDRDHFDLAGYVRARLEGLELGAVADLGRDTYAEPERFFSYRRSVHRGEPDYGRMVAAIALVPAR